ncbi:MAG: hypothetical protein JO210_18975, partial [Acidobacteriaceae bacterium]|nr:hypothetical protein [Acidobacteriaceae bacterium]
MILLNSGLFRKPLAWLTLCVLLSFLVLVYPLYVIRPFRYQGSSELAVALAVIRYRPFLQIALMAVAAVLLMFSWRQSRDSARRVAASACTLLVVLFGILSYSNVYEHIFHPLDRPSFSLAS